MKGFNSCLLSVVCCLLLFSCNNPANRIPVVGEIDSLAIAADTITQQIIENSYEYVKTLPVSDALAYEVVGFGSNSDSLKRYIVIQLSMAKSGSVKRDTIVHGEREGVIKNSWIDRQRITALFENDTVVIAELKK